MPKATEIVRRYFDDASKNIFDHRVQTDVVARRSRRVVDDLRETFGDVRFELAQAFEDGNQVAFQIRVRGKHNTLRRVANWTANGVALVEDQRITSLNLKDDKRTRDLQLGMVRPIGLGGVSGRWSGVSLGVYFYLHVKQAESKLSGTLTIQGVGPFDITEGQIVRPHRFFHHHNRTPRISIVAVRRNGTDQIEFTGRLVEERLIRGTVTGFAQEIELIKGEG